MYTRTTLENLAVEHALYVESRDLHPQVMAASRKDLLDALLDSRELFADTPFARTHTGIVLLITATPRHATPTYNRVICGFVRRARDWLDGEMARSEAVEDYYVWLGTCAYKVRARSFAGARTALLEVLQGLSMYRDPEVVQDMRDELTSALFFKYLADKPLGYMGALDHAGKDPLPVLGEDGREYTVYGREWYFGN